MLNKTNQQVEIQEELHNTEVYDAIIHDAKVQDVKVHDAQVHDNKVVYKLGLLKSVGVVAVVGIRHCQQFFPL